MGRADNGLSQRATSFYVYANVSDPDGGPGVKSVTADVSNLTSGASEPNPACPSGPFTGPT